MTPELFKELQAAGFILDKCEEGPCCKGRFGDDWHYPTTQEVIDACGDDFRSLIKRDGGWEAHSRMYKDEDNVTQVDEWIAPTALEVVSRLFIAIKARTSPLSN